MKNHEQADANGDMSNHQFRWSTRERLVPTSGLAAIVATDNLAALGVWFSAELV